MSIVHVGNRKGRICVWLTESEAIDMAEHYGRHDGFSADLMEAVKAAYPEEPEVEEEWPMPPKEYMD